MKINLVCCILIAIGVADSYKILMFNPLGKSHLNVFMPLMKELKSRNHEVHVLTASPVAKFIPPELGFKTIEFKGWEFNEEEMKHFMFSSLESDAITKILEFEMFAASICGPLLSSDTMKQFVTTGIQYDLAIVDGLFQECGLSVALLIAKNVIDLSTAGLFPWKTTSVPQPPSIVQSFFEESRSKMDFWERMRSAYIMFYTKKIYKHKVLPLQQSVLEKYFPQAPSVYEAEKKVFFHFTNADPVITPSLPTAPNVIDIGGMHCGKPRPLAKEFEDFANSAKETGFIMFGLGSNARSDFLPAETKKAFVDAFSKLKVKVLWKYETEFEGKLPSNVKITKWMPQQALLGHPNIRLFITHGGLLSLQEAIYHGVPVIGVPLFAEQPGNVARMRELGIGEKLSLLNVTADGVYGIITQVLNDNSYSTNMKKYSAVFRDQPQTPLERAVFWTEYVVRHNGANHLRSPGEDLNFFQYFLLDVIALVFGVALLALSITVFSVKFVFKKLCGGKCSKQKKA